MIPAKHLLSITAILFLISISLSYLDTYVVARVARSLCELMIILVLPSIAITAFVKQRSRLKLDLWETVTVASTGIVIIPALNLLPLYLINTAPAFLPYVVSITILSLHAISAPPSSMPIGLLRQIPIQRRTFWIALTIYVGITLALILAYPTLPDLDPYYWLQNTQQFNAGQPSADFSTRPLFFSFIHLFTSAAHIDPFAFFKYVFPLLSSLYLIPAWLLAKTYSTPAKKYAVLAIPLLTPSTLLYLQMPIPQALLILSSYYFLFLILYANQKKIVWPYLYAGIIITLSTLFHEIAILIFGVWLLVTVINYRKPILSYSKHNPVILVLLSLLLITNTKPGTPIYALVNHWSHRIMGYLVNFNTNWRFPAWYINIDGNSMGWPGFTGVLKYYAYYAGPAIVFLIFVTIAYLIRNPGKLKKYTNTKEFYVFSGSFLIFLTISELLPRVFDLALLPERSWIFAGIMASASLILNLAQNSHSRAIAITVLTLAAISVSGALFTNYHKKYIVPDYQLASALWIQENLPSDRIFISTGNKNLLTFHSGSLTLLAPPAFYCAPNEESNIILTNLINTQMPSHLQFRKTATNNFLAETNLYLGMAPLISINNINQITEKHFRQLETFRNTIDLNQLKSQTYIYYYHDDRRHPLLTRPYYSQTTLSDCSYHNFHTREDMEIIYNDSNKVEIWKFK